MKDNEGKNLPTTKFGLIKKVLSKINQRDCYLYSNAQQNWLAFSGFSLALTVITIISQGNRAILYFILLFLFPITFCLKGGFQLSCLYQFIVIMIIDNSLSFENELIMGISFILYPSIYCIVTGKTHAAPFILICSILHFKSDEQIADYVQIILTIFFTVITIQLVSYIRILSKQLQNARNELLHKNNFTCAIIHELRNPLNAVLGSLDVISQSLGDMQSSKIALIKNAQDSGEILSGMISNMLDAGKIEAGKFDLNVEKIEIRKLIWKIIQVNKANAVRKGLSLEMQTDTAVPKYLQLDKCRTIQILMNLMSNAIKFTDEGGVKFRISWIPDNVQDGNRTLKFANQQNEHLVRYSIKYRENDTICTKETMECLDLKLNLELDTPKLAQLIRPVSQIELGEYGKDNFFEQQKQNKNSQNIIRTSNTKDNFKQNKSDQRNHNIHANKVKRKSDPFYKFNFSFYQEIKKKMKRMPIASNQDSSSDNNFKNQKRQSIRIDNLGTFQTPNKIKVSDLQARKKFLTNMQQHDPEIQKNKAQVYESPVLKTLDQNQITKTIMYNYGQERRGIIVFTIKDTGCGIEEKHISKLFKPFQQAHKKISKKYGGTGLGLWISQLILKEMKGKISVKKRKLKGLKFRVEIPLDVSDRNKKPSCTMKLPKQIKILLVHDFDGSH